MKHKAEREKLISCVNYKCKMNDLDYDECCRGLSSDLRTNNSKFKDIREMEVEDDF